MTDADAIDAHAPPKGIGLLQAGEQTLKTAIIHYWIVAERGGEKVLRALCDLFPDAVIFTHVADYDLAARLYPGHEIRTTFISRLPFSKKHYQSYLPLMPMALEELDLSEFDLVLSSESGPAKGVIAPPSAPHICYCHSPMRYIWDHYHLYRRNAGFLARCAFPLIAHPMRQWDVSTAARVDHFIANSKFVASRIKKYYRRSADVVYPPVDVEKYQGGSVAKNDRWRDAYLWIGQLTAYKNPMVALEAANRLKRKLIVIGDGEMAPALRAQAGETIEFLGRADDETVRRAYASCRAMVFPGEEDFGMTPIEAMAAGTPVVALNRGGATETVIDLQTGVLYDDDSTDGLAAALNKFESIEEKFDPAVIQKHANKFGADAFKNQMIQLLNSYGISINTASSAHR